MAVTYRIELDHEGIKALLNSDEIGAVCQEAAERIAQTAGDGFHVTRPYHPAGSRTVYRVYGDSDDARFAEADKKVLSMAVSSCRS